MYDNERNKLIIKNDEYLRNQKFLTTLEKEIVKEYNISPLDLKYEENGWISIRTSQIITKYKIKEIIEKKLPEIEKAFGIKFESNFSPFVVRDPLSHEKSGTASYTLHPAKK